MQSMTDSQEISAESHQAITDVANVIKTYASHDIPLADTLIAEGYQWLRDSGRTPGGVLSADDGDRMVQELALVD